MTRGTLIMVLASTVANALHIPRHYTSGTRPLGIGMAFGATWRDADTPSPKRATGKIRAPATTAPAKVVKSSEIVGRLMEKEEKEADSLARCVESVDCAVQEAELLREQLQAFVDDHNGGWSKVRAAHLGPKFAQLPRAAPSLTLARSLVRSQLMSALSVRNMRARMQGIIHRRRRLMELAETMRVEAGLHQKALNRLERAHRRLQRRLKGSLDNFGP